MTAHYRKPGPKTVDAEVLECIRAGMTKKAAQRELRHSWRTLTAAEDRLMVQFPAAPRPLPPGRGPQYSSVELRQLSEQGFTKREAGAVIGCSLKTVQRMARAGKMKFRYSTAPQYVPPVPPDAPLTRMAVMARAENEAARRVWGR